MNGWSLRIERDGLRDHYRGCAAPGVSPAADVLGRRPPGPAPVLHLLAATGRDGSPRRGPGGPGGGPGDGEAGGRQAQAQTEAQAQEDGASRRAHAAGEASLADRAKVAEALASHAEAIPALLRLAADVDGSVRANAIWSLGAVGKASEVAKVAAALGDRDVAVAGNAAAALGRIAARAKVSVKRQLCRALSDPRSYVRANALLALGVAGQRCDRGEAREVLHNDRSAIVRRAAARLLGRVPSSTRSQDQRVLQRCAEEEPDASVAIACTNAPEPTLSGTEPVMVYVVPMGETSPVPRAPFALVRPDGLMRLGITDRRGTLFEADAPRGEVSLEVPAPLAY